MTNTKFIQKEILRAKERLNRLDLNTKILLSDIHGNFTTVVITAGDRTAVGVAKRIPTDSASSSIGLSIATFRAMQRLVYGDG